jgi:hypothetical protein
MTPSDITNFIRSKSVRGHLKSRALELDWRHEAKTIPQRLD